MTRVLIAVLLLSVLSGCVELAQDIGLGPSRSEMSSKVRVIFDKRKDELESKARAGQITWVQAMQGERDADRILASDDYVRRYSNWKFDSDDEEFHAYCIALAERLDKNQITYAQFDAARKRVFNQVEARRQSLQNQQQLIENSRPRQNNCVTEKVLNRYETKCD